LKWGFLLPLFCQLPIPRSEITECLTKDSIPVFLYKKRKENYSKRMFQFLHMMCDNVYKFVYLASYPVLSLLLNLSEKSIPFPPNVFPLNLLNASLALI
jgi:hypothetical protein